MRTYLAAFAILALVACGQAAAPSEADAQTGSAASASGEVTAADRTAILAVLQMRANAQGQVENACGEMVTPQFQVADVGASVGRAVVFAIGGGATMASCYGDGPLVLLMRNTGGAWNQIYEVRAGSIIVLPTQHGGANDLAHGGPGFSFAVSQWNGSTYVDANRTVADSALSDARFLPN
jgi:hypothetical protein